MNGAVRRLLMLGATLLMFAGCGEADATLVPMKPTASLGSASAPPHGIPSPTIPVLPPVDALLRTEADALAHALRYAEDALHARHPQAQGATYFPQGPITPNGPYWQVYLDGDQFALSPCGPDADLTTGLNDCGTGHAAVLEIRPSDGAIVSAKVYATPATPTYHPLPSTPPDATLRTRDDAAAAALKFVPGKDGKQASIVEIWLLPAKESDARGHPGLAPDAPVWKVVLTEAWMGFPCPYVPERQKPCAGSNVTLWLDAMTGMILGMGIAP